MTTLGFYGKLASRGDFVSRALPQSFIGPWDAGWRRDCMPARTASAGTGSTLYLVSPSVAFCVGARCVRAGSGGGCVDAKHRPGRALFSAGRSRVDLTTTPIPRGVGRWAGTLVRAGRRAVARHPGRGRRFFEALQRQASMLGFRPSDRAAVDSRLFAGLQRVAATVPHKHITALAEKACEGASLWWGRGSRTYFPWFIALPGAACRRRFCAVFARTRRCDVDVRCLKVSDPRSKSHVGMVRQINEDAFLDLPENRLWVVADGMGGHAAGDYVSSLIVDSLRTCAVGRSLDDIHRRRCATT